MYCKTCLMTPSRRSSHKEIFQKYKCLFLLLTFIGQVGVQISLVSHKLKGTFSGFQTGLCIRQGELGKMSLFSCHIYLLPQSTGAPNCNAYITCTTINAYSIYIYTYIAKVPSGDSSIWTSPSVQLCSSPLVGWEDATDDLKWVFLVHVYCRGATFMHPYICAIQNHVTWPDI